MRERRGEELGEITSQGLLFVEYLQRAAGLPGARRRAGEVDARLERVGAASHRRAFVAGLGQCRDRRLDLAPPELETRQLDLTEEGGRHGSVGAQDPDRLAQDGLPLVVAALADEHLGLGWPPREQPALAGSPNRANASSCERV